MIIKMQFINYTLKEKCAAYIYIYPKTRVVTFNLFTFLGTNSLYVLKNVENIDTLLKEQ